MARSIVAVVVGYVALLFVNAMLFTGAYFVVGMDAAFEGDSFQISTLMALCGLTSAFIGGPAGGWICRRVARSETTVRVLIAIAFIVTLLSGVPMLLRSRPAQTRPPGMPRIEAMTQTFHPRWFSVLMPFVHAGGVAALAMRRRLPAVAAA